MEMLLPLLIFHSLLPTHSFPQQNNDVYWEGFSAVEQQNFLRMLDLEEEQHMMQVTVDTMLVKPLFPQSYQLITNPPAFSPYFSYAHTADVEVRGEAEALGAVHRHDRSGDGCGGCCAG